MSDVVDGTAVEVEDAPAPDHHRASASTDVVRRERRSEVIRPLAVDDLVESFGQYQELLPRLLNDSDYQAAEAGKKFVKKSGWRKIATAFDLDVVILHEDVDRDADGRILRSKTVARATAPSGRTMDGDGYCTVDEFTGQRARNPKIENDLRGTAATRAKNRAIADLVGMGDVSAEEASVGGSTPAARALEAANEHQKKQMLDALVSVIGERSAAVEYAKAIAKAAGGEVPAVVAMWTSALPAFIKAGAARAEATPAPAPAPASPVPVPHDFDAWARDLGDDDLVGYASSDPDGSGIDTPERVHAARRELERRMPEGVDDGVDYNAAAPVAQPTATPVDADAVERAAAAIDAGATPGADRPAPGSVDPPDLSGTQDPAKRAAYMRQAGCTCLRPNASNRMGRDDLCPLRGHGLAGQQAMAGATS